MLRAVRRASPANGCNPRAERNLACLPAMSSAARESQSKRYIPFWRRFKEPHNAQAHEEEPFESPAQNNGRDHYLGEYNSEGSILALYHEIYLTRIEVLCRTSVACRH